jgi:hypothetical protein
MLTPERAQEIAELATSITGSANARATERVLQIANHLNGTSA